MEFGFQLSVWKANMQRAKIFPVRPQMNSIRSTGGRTWIKMEDSKAQQTEEFDMLAVLMQMDFGTLYPTLLFYSTAICKLLGE